MCYTETLNLPKYTKNLNIDPINQQFNLVTLQSYCSRVNYLIGEMLSDVIHFVHVRHWLDNIMASDQLDTGQLQIK